MENEESYLMRLIKKRRSVRKYLQKGVEDDKIRMVMEAARLAPSWANWQCWRFVVVRDPETMAKVCSAVTKGTRINFWIKGAPAIIVCCAEPESSGTREGQNYYLVDCAIAMEHLVLMATELGLGTCWVGVFDEKELKEVLGVPEHVRVVALTPLGYERIEKKGLVDIEGIYGKAVKTIKSKKRKKLEEIVYSDGYGNDLDF